MKIIIDECVPSIVKRGLPDRAIQTVQEMRWPGNRNVSVLKAQSGYFVRRFTRERFGE